MAAGESAAERFAYREAVGHFQKGLEIVQRAGDEPWCVRREIQLQNALGVVLMAARRFVPEMVEAHSRARELCREVREPEQLTRAIYGLWLFNSRQAHFEAAAQLSEELLAMVEHEPRPSLTLQAHHATWTTSWQRGELDAAWRHAEIGRQLYRSDQHYPLANAYGGHDAGVCSRYTSAVVSWLRGFPEQAVAWGREGLALSRELGHPFSETLALEFVTLVHEFRREPSLVEDQVRALVKVSADQDFRIRTAIEPLHNAWLQLERGEPEQAMVQIGKGFTAMSAMGAHTRKPYYLAMLAQAHLAKGRHDLGLATIGQALDLVYQTDERWWEAELHRLRGELMLARRARDLLTLRRAFVAPWGSGAGRAPAPWNSERR